MFRYQLKQIKKKKPYSKYTFPVFIVTIYLMRERFAIKRFLHQQFSFSLKVTTFFYVNVNYISV